ncbi:hypothetical protein LTS17_006781 [Exophiala oligosperma]
MDTSDDSSEEHFLEVVPGDFPHGSIYSDSHKPCHLCEVTRKALLPNGGPQQTDLYDDQNRRFVRLGCWDELLRSTDCSTCACIVAHFQSSIEEKGANLDLDHYSYWLADFYNRNFYLRLESDNNESGPYGWPQVTILPIGEDRADVGASRVNRRWANLQRVRNWLGDCDLNHTSCQRPGVNPATFNFRMYLIDIKNKCLVRATGREEYIALSYAWGKASPTTQTMKENVAKRCELGGLFEGKKTSIPGTLRRAIITASQFDVNLIWIDQLCIVQDDPVHKMAQINHMDIIYAASYLTFCIADGDDAENGLRGVQQTLLPRNIEQDVLAFSDGADDMSWAVYIRSTADSNIYGKRGWTFQEALLSPRTLTFKSNGLHWRCNHVAGEEQERSFHKTHEFDFILRPQDISWPNVMLWSNLLSSYYKRELTHEGDALPAVIGVLNTFGSSTLGGFYYDHPETFFDAAMLWLPTGRLRRRLGIEQYPSWSRVGWSGPTTSQINPFGLFHQVRIQSSWEEPDRWDRIRTDLVYPTVTWWKCGPDQQKTVAVANDYLIYRTEYLGQCSSDPPDGWAVDIDPEFGMPYYMFDKAPDREAFWYPVPTAGKPDLRSQQRTRFLRFETSTIQLKLGEAAQMDEGNESDPVRFTLWTDAGEWAGILFHHDSAAAFRGQDIELVQISGGQLHEGTDQGWVAEWSAEGRPRVGNVYEYYNAILIQRQGTYCERQGLARIPKVIWDRLSKGKTEILLG